jgi:hypothetical protein
MTAVDQTACPDTTQQAAQTTAPVRETPEQALRRKGAEMLGKIGTVVSAWGIQSPLYEDGRLNVSVMAKRINGEPFKGTVARLLNDEHQVVASADLRPGALRYATSVYDPAPAPVEVEAGSAEERDPMSVRGELSAAAPVPGLHSWMVVVEDEEGRILAQKKVPFSVVPKANRTVRVKVVDDKSGQPVKNAVVFLFNKDVEKTMGVKVVADDQGVADVPASQNAYLVRTEAHDYVEGRVELEASAGDVEVEVPMRSKFNLRVKRPF